MNEFGKIAESEWIKSPQLRPDMNLKLGSFVVMPNHFHAIICIGNNEYNSNCGGRTNCWDRINCRDAMHCVPTMNDTTNGYQNQFGPQSKNLASVIRGFKSSVTTHVRKINPEFAWQSRYHDHIIRNNEAFERIQIYIKNNPLNWGKDKFHNAC